MLGGYFKYFEQILISATVEELIERSNNPAMHAT